MALNSSNFQILVAATLDAANIQKQLNAISKKYGTIKINLDVNTNALNEATNSLGNLNTNLHETSVAAKESSQSIGDIIAKVTKFGAATLIINKFRESIIEGYQAVKDLDASVTEYSKVSDLSSTQMKNYIEDARELGLTVARTADEMIEAATEFKKMGNDDSASLILGQQATMFQNIADEAITAGDSASFINSQMKAFNLTANETIHILDAVNEVANNFAVSSGDISTALPKVASTMALAGNSFEETMGLLTAGAEIIPNQASRIARGLRSVTLNLQGLDEDGEAVAGMTAKMQGEFDKLGISLMDSQGQIKSTYDIFSELAEVFPKLDKNTQTYYASLIGGKTQVDIVSAILLNFNTAINATETAMNSAGSAMKENEKYLDSIQGRIAALTSEFQKFWTEGISSDSVKNIVSLGTGFLKLINYVGGLPTVLTAIVGIIATLKGYKIFETFKGGVNYVRQFTAALKETKAEGYSTAQAFKAMGDASSAVTLGIGLLSAALTVTIGVMSAIKQHQEDLRTSALQAGEAFNTEVSDLNNLKSKLNEIWDSEDSEYEKAKQLAEVRDHLATKYGIEKEALDKLNSSRQDGINLLDTEIRSRAESVYAQNLTEIEKAQEYLSREDIKISLPLVLDENTFDEELRNKVHQLFEGMEIEFQDGIIGFEGNAEKLKTAMEKLVIYLSDIEDPTIEESQMLGGLISSLDLLTETYTEYSDVLQKNANDIVLINQDVLNFIDGQYNSKEAMEEAKKAALDSVGANQDLRAAVEALATQYFPEYIDKLEESNESLKDSSDTIDEYMNKMQELAGQLSSAQNAYDTLTKVVKEYNETGSLTFDTLSSLLKLNPQYIEALSMQNGELVVNIDSLETMSREYVEAGYNALAGVTGIDTFSTALDNSATAGADASQRIADAGNAAIKAGQQALEGAKGFAALISAMAASVGTFGKEMGGVKSYPNGFDGPLDSYNQNKKNELINNLINNSHINTSVGGGGGGKKGGGGSVKDDAEKAAKEAAKAYKQAFQDELDEAQFKLDMGQINAGEFYLEFDKLNKKYYEGKEEYLEEYRDNYLKIVEGLHSSTVGLYQEEQDALDHKLAMDYITEEEYIEELKRLWYEYYKDKAGYEKESNALEEKIYSLESKRIDKLKEKRRKAWEEETDWLNEQKSRYETAFNYIDSLAQKEIDKLEEQKQAIEDKYNAEIDKINEKQDALEDEIALQEKLEALARAQNTKVRIYREGQGFVYETDQSAVDEAKSALTQYQKEQETKKEIKRLEDIRDATIESVEEQIKYWEKYRQEWKDMVNSYTDSQNKLIAEQVLGISLEGENWEKRLGNLQTYVDRYNSILSQLKHRGSYDDDDDWDDDDYDYGGGSGTAGGGGTIGPGDHAGSGGHWDSSDSSHGPGVAANGTTTGYGLTMVGEKGRELRVLGSGVNEADGVVPNHLTENLMQLGKYSPRQWADMMSSSDSRASGNQYSYNFGSLVLPNVINANNFINELKNIKNQAIQMGGKRN